MSQPVLFLDIDGVLNSTRSAAAYGGYPWPGTHKPRDWHKFDPVAVALLQRVCRRSGAVCVLSSSWRLGMTDSDRNDLAAHLGIEIIGVTRPTLAREQRGNQIADWLAAHPEVTTWAIVDDDSDMLPKQMERFVKVRGEDGLSYLGHVRLIELLGGKP